MTGALTVQRKHVGKEMLEFGDGVIYGDYDAKNKSLVIGGGSTDSWISG